MPQHHVFDTQLRRLLTGLLDRVVFFLIGVEPLLLCMTAQNLPQQPVRTARGLPRPPLHRLISGKHHRPAAVQRQMIAVLQGFLRADVKKRDVPSRNKASLSILDRNEENKPSDHLVEFRPQHHPAHAVQHIQNLPMSVEVQRLGVLALRHRHGEHADDPQRAQTVIHMRMAEKHVVNIPKRNPHLIQPEQQTVSAAGVGQQEVIPFFERKTGVE